MLASVWNRGVEWGHPTSQEPNPTQGQLFRPQLCLGVPAEVSFLRVWTL